MAVAPGGTATIAEINAWIDAHGGPHPTLSSPADAQGRITYYAADGSTLTASPSPAVRGAPASSQIETVNETASATASSPTTPTAPSAPAPGSQAAVLAIVRQIAPGGDTSKLEFNQGTRTKTIAGLAGNETVQVPFVQWVDRATGRTVEYEINDTGTYTEVFNGTKPENKTGNRPGETDKPDERPNPADRSRMQRWNPTTKAWEDAGPNQVGVEANEDRNHPTVTSQQVQRGGKTYTVVTSTPKDGKPPTITTLGPDGQVVPGGVPDEPGGGKRVPVPNKPGIYTVTTKNPQTNVEETHYENEQGQRVTAPVDATKQPIPATAPKFTPDYNLPDLGIVAYHRQLDEWVNSGATGASRELAIQLLEQAGQEATTVASHGTTLASQAATARGQDITQRGQDIGEVQSRRSSANDMFQSAFKSTDEGARRLMGGDEALAGEAMRAALNLGRLNAEAAGGMQQIPQVPPAYVAALGGTPDTQVSVGPSGHVAISPPGAPPLGAQPAPGGFDPQVAAAGRSNAAAVPSSAPTASAMGPGSPGWNQPAYMPQGPLVRTRDPWGNEGVMSQRDVERSNAMPGGALTVLGPATAPPLSDGTSPFLPGVQPVGMAPGNPYTTALGGMQANSMSMKSLDDNTERPDDILTIRYPNGQTIQMSRADYQGFEQDAPGITRQWQILESRPNPRWTRENTPGAALPPYGRRPASTEDVPSITQQRPAEGGGGGELETPYPHVPGSGMQPPAGWPQGVPWQPAGPVSSAPHAVALTTPYATALGGSARPPFQPDRAALKARFPDLSDQDLDEVIREHVGAMA